MAARKTAAVTTMTSERKALLRPINSNHNQVQIIREPPRLLLNGGTPRRTLPDVDRLHPWMLPMTPGFLPSPIHPRKLSLKDKDVFFEDDPPHPTEVLREVAKLATFPAVGM
uniref:Uncharacterized protein n=1 Tax=Panagrolaimus sp. JU765 TaxID=591449 RepID=A0AC34QSI8_9BILA